jgi:hypothetical protein
LQLDPSAGDRRDRREEQRRRAAAGEGRATEVYRSARQALRRQGKRQRTSTTRSRSAIKGTGNAWIFRADLFYNSAIAPLGVLGDHSFNFFGGLAAGACQVVKHSYKNAPVRNYAKLDQDRRAQRGGREQRGQ